MDCVLCQSKEADVFYTDHDSQFGEKAYYQCARCSLIFLSPQAHLNCSEEKSRYDLHENSPDDKDYVKFLNRLAGPLSGKLKSGMRGLDFGCGPGPAMREILKGKECVVENYDPYYFPEPGRLSVKYDFVTCSEVVEHFYNPRNDFIVLNGLLKDQSSYLGIMTRMFGPQVDFKTWWYRTEPTHVCFYQKETFDWIGNWLKFDIEFPAENVVIYSRQD